MTAAEIEHSLKTISDPEKAVFVARYFKTGPGQYGEGDQFVGLTVPVLRGLAKEYKGLPLPEATLLLKSPIHEARLLSLLIMVAAWKKATAAEKELIYGIYLGHTRYINNWDLVDASADHIVGAHLLKGDRTILTGLAASPLIWERRIAIMATFHFIKLGQFSDTLTIAQLLLSDGHDLIHKAVGWMLREVGKRDQECEEKFLKLHCREMPRTMLRYAIEKFPEGLRRRYMAGNIE
jgi:3-methyladenine DNA glycosylase AlkD